MTISPGVAHFRHVTWLNTLFNPAYLVENLHHVKCRWEAQKKLKNSLPKWRKESLPETSKYNAQWYPYSDHPFRYDRIAPNSIHHARSFTVATRLRLPVSSTAFSALTTSRFNSGSKSSSCMSFSMSELALLFRDGL